MLSQMLEKVERNSNFETEPNRMQRQQPKRKKRK